MDNDKEIRYFIPIPEHTFNYFRAEAKKQMEANHKKFLQERLEQEKRKQAEKPKKWWQIFKLRRML